MKKKILIIVGTRPEFLKIATLYLHLKKEKTFKVYLCLSGQHKNMISSSLRIFSITPDYIFNIYSKNNSLRKLTSLILKNSEVILKKIKPNLLIVQGDTVTTYSSSLSAFYQNIPVAHIEAGLRTYDLLNPFPEELLRQIISRISKFHFVPELQNKSNLINEKVNSKKIFITGNTIIDTLQLILSKIKKNIKYKIMLNKKIKKILKFNYLKKDIVLITIHRRENIDTGIKSLCRAIKILSIKYPNCQFIMPVHPNPKVKNFIFHYLYNRAKNIHLTKPLDYEVFLLLMKNSKFILTDSGGIQEEAPSLGKPVLVLRKTTERTKSIELKNSLLIGSQLNNIVKKCDLLFKNKKVLLSMSKINNIYGDGKASQRIIRILKKIKFND
jgi:UDP-N-acetylglucosamine 2-epimerase (non-hydrolysing)